MVTLSRLHIILHACSYKNYDKMLIFKNKCENTRRYEIYNRLYKFEVMTNSHSNHVNSTLIFKLEAN